MIRQGDLLFLRCDEIPEEAKKKTDPKGVIAEGEVTGHLHQIRPGTEAALYIGAALAYIQCLQETPIDHDEHDTVILSVGDWVVKRQREYEPDGWRQIAD